MIAYNEAVEGSGRFPRGVHLDDRKTLTRALSIEIMPAPETVQVPTLQHTGAPCAPVVAAKQQIAAGEVLADSDAFVSAPVHSPVAGTVLKETVATLPNGRHVKVIPVQAAPDQPAPEAIWADTYGGDWPLEGIDTLEPEAVVKAIRAAGIVGQGGAAFPTHVKLVRNPNKPVGAILVNGCECEPFLTADDRLMIEAPAPIVAGALIAARAAGASRVVIAIEDNKPEAIAAMRRASDGRLTVAGMSTRYPMGGEKQTVRAALGRTIPTGGLPLDVGVVVINVASAAAIARAVLRGKPLTHRVVCVTGAGVASPKNLLVPVGTSYQAVLDRCGGLLDSARRVVSGGPMMGFAMGGFQAPITKGTGGIVALTAEDIRRSEETACVRCGRCVDVCPLNLAPSRLALASRHKDWAMARRYHLAACMECGCCAYVCPASIPLVQLMRMGKVQMMKEMTKQI